MRLLGPGLLVALVFTGACDGCNEVSIDGGAGPGAGGGGSSELPPPEIAWHACPEAELQDLSCADIEVPLDWDAPQGRAITIHVRRLEATVEARGAVWLLEGGPGAPGSWMLDYAAHMHDTHPDLDVFVPDHRGTGESTPLVCSPQTDPPTAACIASLHEDEALLLGVNSSAAGRDVAALAEWTTRGDALLLYGRSYGTYWAHRTASLAPETFDALVLDSPCSPIDGCPASERDAGIDVVGHELLSHCADDAACVAHLGFDAETFATGVVASADAGACASAVAAGIDGDRLRYMLARLLGGEDTRGVIPALLFRYQRCALEDEAVFATLAAYFDQLDALSETALASLSIPTNYQVTFAEWWDETFTVADASAQQDAAVFATAASVRWAETFGDGTWTALPRDPQLRAWRIDGIPTLVLVGGMDTATPRASVENDMPAIADDSHWELLAFAGHVSSAGEGPYAACARSLVDGFLDAPGPGLDDGCVGTVDLEAGVTLFEVPENTALVMLGTTDLYD